MSRTLQLKWTDEPNWRSVRELRADESELDVLRKARADRARVDLRYKHHTFSAEFRVIDTSVQRFSRQLDIA